MSIFGLEVDAAAEVLRKAKIKAKEFEGEGLVLQFLTVERVKSQYGAEAEASIVEKGILEEGEQFAFDFLDAEGTRRRLWSTSMPFFVSMQQAEISEGDWLKIRREGVKDKTRYSITKVEAPGAFTGEKKPLPNPGPKKPDYPKDDINPDDIPF